MNVEAEIYPIDTKDLETAEKIKVIIKANSKINNKAFIGYLDLGARINRIEWKTKSLNSSNSYENTWEYMEVKEKKEKGENVLSVDIDKTLK